MLVLTRKPNEQIFIGNDITLTIAEIRGDYVRIAIDAPKDIKIYRGEIYQSILEENREAARKDSGFDVLKNFKANPLKNTL
jgi:carbon storage regulator